jgi:ATP-dependent helicase HrpB
VNPRLPIYDQLPALREALNNHNTVILEAAPGAGKSTVVPLELMNESWLGDKKIIMLEPRRLAAKSVAKRMASQLHEDVSERVGYRVRMEQAISKKTKIEVVTEGILVRLLQNDNALSEYGLVIFDEFHERSIHSDLSLALTREAAQILRPDLKMLIMSATMDTKSLSAALDQAPVLSAEGKIFTVAFQYVEEPGHLSLAQQTCNVVKTAWKKERGDILVFLPGSGDILRAAEQLERDLPDALIYPLYGDLNFDAQQRAIEPDALGRRKIIIATSIAETSLTIEGVRVVVDSGYTRKPKYNAQTGFTKLETVRISMDAAAQRAGRAGRLGPGVCYRLWPEVINRQLTPQRIPEILEADLTDFLLEITNWGYTSTKLPMLLVEPPATHLERAREILIALRAIENDKITTHGKQLLQLATHPRIAHLLLTGKALSVAAAACDVAALLEERDPLPRQEGADLALRLHALRDYRGKKPTSGDRRALDNISRIAKRWMQIIKAEEHFYSPDAPEIGQLIASAYPERIAKRIDTSGRYRLANGRIAALNKGDVLTDEEWLAVAELDEGTGGIGKIFTASVFHADDLLDQSLPIEIVRYDERNQTLICKREWRIFQLCVKEEKLNGVDQQEIEEVWFQVIHKEGVRPSEEQLNEWYRLQAVQQWRPELELPDFSLSVLQQHPERYLQGHLGNCKTLADINALPFAQIVLQQLSWEQQQTIDRIAPKKMTVPSGSEITIQYAENGGQPILAARLQEVFGWKTTPTINDGRTKLLIHLLSPAFRPVQITQDLEGFWKTGYPEIKKELRIKYHKHSWPDDPATALAVRGAVKRKL